jgi:NAD(P)-dependent dehydrogenase (short-subunit alcohol dehydrogenase family)
MTNFLGGSFMRLQDKVSLIVGGTSGIGLATAGLFSKEGAKVVIVGRQAEKGQAAVDEIRRRGGDATFVRADVSREDEATRTVESTIQRFGRMDVLFNNAGISPMGKICDTTADEWDTVMAVNLKGVFLVSKAAIPVMERSGGGSIINTSSIFGVTGSAIYAAYCAAKAGVIGLTKAMALECAQKKIRVNCISPGAVRTEMMEQEFIIFSQEKGIPVDVLREAHAKKSPLRKLADPEEIAPLVVYLASDESSFVTGSNFVIDGGRLASCDSPA